MLNLNPVVVALYLFPSVLLIVGMALVPVYEWYLNRKLDKQGK